MLPVSIDNCPIANIRLEKHFNTYSISVKTGEYYEFDYTKISNEIHYHNCHELVFVLQGRGEFLYEGRSFILHKGGIFISEPYRNHEIHIRANEKLVLIYFMIRIHKRGIGRPKQYEEIILEQFLKFHKNARDRQESLMSYFSYFENYNKNHGAKEDRWFIRILENFIFNCIESLLIEKPEPENRIELQGDLLDRALDYIDSNLARKMTAGEIAQNINTSRRNLYRLFQEKMHRPVHDYINESKISLAKNYLDMNCSVSESAALSGFEDPSRFSSLFKKYTGIPPREYKKQRVSKKDGFGRRMT